MSRQLRVIGGRDSGRVFTLTEGQPLLLGRDQGTHGRLKDPQVAMLHCEVVLQGEVATLTDRGSSGGTFIGATRVARHALATGEVFRIGDTRIRLE
jgi:S-DNA-T family DNA segregation ATPase FtsK/SpoIIIE